MQRKREMQERQQFLDLSINSDRVAEWLRRWTANPIPFPCVRLNPISVGILLGSDPKLKHAELQAPLSEQQTQFLENIWFKKIAKKQQTNVITL